MEIKKYYYSKKDKELYVILRLENFKCHSNVQVGIPKKGTTLVKGESGKGKTSLLEGFLFVLFDSVYKPKKLDSDTCNATLVFDDIYVYRQKNPDFLKLWIGDTVYEGDDAQEIIDRKFGNQDIFVATSYIKQFQHSVFLGDSDIEKMKIIKGISKIDPNVEKFKQIIENKTLDLEKLKMKYSIEREFLEKEIEKIDISGIDRSVEPISELKDRLKSLQIDLEKTIKLEKSREVCMIMKEKWEKKISELKEIEKSDTVTNFFEIYDRQKFSSKEEFEEELKIIDDKIEESEQIESEFVTINCASCDQKIKFFPLTDEVRNISLMSGGSMENKETSRSIVENRLKIDQLRDKKKDIEEIIAKFVQISQISLNRNVDNEIEIRSEDIKKFESVFKSEIQIPSEKIRDEIDSIEEKIELSSKVESFDKLDDLKKNLDECNEKFKSVEENLKSLERIDDARQVVERKLLSETIEKLNSILQKHLRQVFPNSAISVVLSIDNESEKDFFQMKIFSNNRSYENPAQLSGGEKSRISIALMLSLNEIKRSPFIFLDETLSSTHTDLKPEIIKYLGDYSKEKSCIVVGHEEIEGLYDNIIKL